MTEELTQEHQTIKAEYDTAKKSLTNLESKQVTLQYTLIRLNFNLQLQGRGITRSLPSGFMAGGNSR